jgi:mannose-1-phosphate guanylyltransferase
MTETPNAERRTPNALFALILAGGASSRFWPLSGDENPKYLLRIGEQTLLELAWHRALACTDASRIFLITGGAQAHLFPEALPALHTPNLIVEPARRDTAAAIALGVRRISAIDPHAWILVLPADQLIEPVDALAAGIRRAQATDGAADAIHIFGVEPTRAEPGFGYIQPGDELAPGIGPVKGFREKPGRSAAEQFVRDGWLWNAGCFLFNAGAFERELKQHLPGHSSRLNRAVADPGEREYAELDSISIDYGLIEKASNLRVISLAAEFDDIGTWDALLRRMPQGAAEAISVGGGANRAIGAQVAVVGESNLLVVVNGNRVLVLKQGHGHDVKKVGGPARESEAAIE